MSSGLLIKHALHDSKPLPPLCEALLNGIPLLIHYMALNYDLFFDLINFSVNNTSGNGLNGPLLYIVLLNVQNVGQVVILVVRVLQLERANLNILLLADHIRHL